MTTPLQSKKSASEELTKEQAQEILSNLIDRINRQDNRATAFPYFVQLRQKEKQYLCNCYGEGGYFAFREGDGERPVIKAKDAADAAKILNEQHDYQDLTEDDIEKMSVFEYDRVVGTFLTYDGLERHMAQNKHNYSEGETHNYVEYSFRNPELVEVFKAISALVGKPIRGIK